MIKQPIPKQCPVIAVGYGKTYSLCMSVSPINIAIFVAMAAVLVVLVVGIANLAMTGDKARSRSNQLMRLRVLVQFIAVVLLMVGFWLKSRSL